MVLEKESQAVHVETDETYFIVFLNDGRRLTIPLEWYPRLAHASPEERANYTFFAEGTVLEWPDLDEHISVEGLLAGRQSQESRLSLKKWKVRLQERRENPDQFAWAEAAPLPERWDKDE